MTEKDLAEDYRMVLHEAKSMGCNKIKALYNIPLKNIEMIIQALEKQIPKSPDYEGDGYSNGDLVYDTWVCPCCGQTYEVDKVVEQLNNAKKYNLDLADTMLDIQANGTIRHFICLEDAIKIVKAGGNIELSEHSES